jgi:hypothetical protein
MYRLDGRVCIGLLVVVVGWICLQPMFASADLGKRIAKADPRAFATDDGHRDRGTVGELGFDDAFEVKSYAVTSDFNVHQNGVPINYTLFFFSEKDGQGVGRFWKDRKAEDVEAMTTLMDTAWKAGRSVYYDRKIEQLSAGILPIKT